MSNRSLALAGPTPDNRFAPLAPAPRRAGIQRVIAQLPDPDEQAYRLCEREIVALRTAWQVRDGLRCEETFRAELFREGLADKGGYLTVWGVAVRRAAMVVDA